VLSPVNCSTRGRLQHCLKILEGTKSLTIALAYFVKALVIKEEGVKALFCHFHTTSAGSVIRTHNFRIMSRMFYHCITVAQCYKSHFILLLKLVKFTKRMSKFTLIVSLGLASLVLCFLLAGSGNTQVEGTVRLTTLYQLVQIRCF
jgi:hypothetical protein